MSSTKPKTPTPVLPAATPTIQGQQDGSGQSADVSNGTVNSLDTSLINTGSSGLSRKAKTQKGSLLGGS